MLWSLYGVGNQQNHIEESGIGKIVFLYRQKEKDPTVKQMAQRLIGAK